MKKLTILALSLVLTTALLTGCGCRNYAMPSTEPMTMPSTAPTTAPAPQPTTAPATQPTTAATTEPTIDYGNGPITEATGDGAITEGRSRALLPSDK